MWLSVQEWMEESWFATDHYATLFTSGHGAFRAKLHKFHLVKSPICRSCAVEDTVLHTLLYFTIARDKREVLVQSLLETGRQLSIRTIFRDPVGNRIFLRHSIQLSWARDTVREPSYRATKGAKIWYVEKLRMY